jgi:cystathionine beta-lyase
MEGTYLAWIDIRWTGQSSDAITNLLLNEAKVMVSSGSIFGKRDGEGFIRINLACPKARIEDGLQRIVRTLSRKW